MKPAKYIICLALFAGLSPVAGLSDPVFVAGTEPSQRPADAPVITEMSKDADWYAAALEGVETPYPASLRWLEDQGNWFNPFTKPGMTGPYDIRAHH